LRCQVKWSVPYCCHFNSRTLVVVVVWKLHFQLHIPMQSVPVTTKVVSSNPFHGEMCSIQLYVIMLVSTRSLTRKYFKHLCSHALIMYILKVFISYDWRASFACRSIILVYNLRVHQWKYDNYDMSLHP
jgi:hypothetical protein